VAHQAPQPRFEAEQLSAKLPNLILAALRVAATVTAGVHGRRRSGPGDAFWQFRHYQPGDPARSIDWRRSARGDPIFVRENEWQAAQTLWLWCDRSPSMRWRSSRRHPEKGDRALVLMLALASLLLRGGEQIGLAGTGGTPVRGPNAFGRFAEFLARLDAAAASLPPAAALQRHAQIVLIGDLLSPLPALTAMLRGHAARGVRGHLLQVLDPAEEALSMHGRVLFEGMEDEGELLVRRVDRIRGDYRRRLEAHRAALTDLARQLGWTFAVHHTDRPAEHAVLALHAALSLDPRP